MKVKLKSSWTNPINGRILKEGTEVDLDDKFFNKDYHEEVKKVKSPKKEK